MHVSSGTGQQNSIYGVKKSIDLGDAWTSGEHQREGVRDFADAQKIVFPNMLDVQDVINRVGTSNYADYWLAHFSSSLLRRCKYTWADAGPNGCRLQIGRWLCFLRLLSKADSGTNRRVIRTL